MVSLQLCALGTVGVAAAGLAFGRPEHSIAARPTSNKRRAVPSAGSRGLQDQTVMPITPSPLPISDSASTSRLRKRPSSGRPMSSASLSRGGIKTQGNTPDGSGILDDGGKILQPSLHLQQSRQSIGTRSFTFEPGSENVPSPSWLHRKSTLSSLKSGSPATTERPGSSSVSYSNGSAAPIFPRDSSPSTPSRNKLVKRSASQRALDGGSRLHSTLRRPATSHQRSATLQRNFGDSQLGQRSSIVPSLFDPPRSEVRESYDGLTQLWRPFFKPHIARPTRDTVSRKRNTHGGTIRDDGFKTVVATITEIPTLVMASSISIKPSQEDNGRISNVSAFSRPFTPVGWRNYESQSSDLQDTPPTESKTRTSFSLTDMFPSPSPMTWKIPRTGTLRNKKSFVRTGGRRVVSAPQPLKPRPILTAMQGIKSTSGKSTSADDATVYSSPLAHKSGPMRGYQVPPSSPLPPLNRLSAFEVDLPENVPSYPTSPVAEASPPMPRVFSEVSSPAISSSMAIAGNPNQSHRPSGALSDHTSTLLGSENDNSRFLSGDEEDGDTRSDTVFDSTRTAATSNSVTGSKRPPIETIFDKSISPRLSPSTESVGKKELTYISINQSRQELPIRVHKTRSIHLDSPPGVNDVSTNTSREPSTTIPATQDSLLASAPLKLSTAHHPSAEMAVDDDEVLWSIDAGDDADKSGTDSKDIGTSNDTDHVITSPRTRENTPKRRQSPPSTGASRSSKGNIFEWSERLDAETSPDGSPRPKTVHGRQGRENGGNRSGGRRGHSALHLRSQSVPVPNDNRVHNNPHAKLESWVLGNKGPSEDWDGDFDFEPSAPRDEKHGFPISNGPLRTSLPSGIQVPQTILERQATVHSQFGQVKELTLLVEELKRLQQQASALDIMTGQSIELWKEAEGIINLATLNDDEEDMFPSRSPRSPSGFDFDVFDEDSPSSRPRRTGLSPPVEDRLSTIDDASTQTSSRPSQELSHSNVHTPPSSRPRKESSAKAKSVLENIHQQRNHHDPGLLGDPGMVHNKLAFDTTSLKDLVTRAGVVTRALKEIVRRAEGGPLTPERREPSTRRDQPDPPDPPFSQIFQNPPSPPSSNKAPRTATSPRSTSTKGSKSPKSQKSQKSAKGSPYLGGGGSIASNDNEINGHMKMMTVV